MSCIPGSSKFSLTRRRSEEWNIVIDHSTKEANRCLVSLLEEAQEMEATACVELTVHRSATKAWPLLHVPNQPYPSDLFQ